MCLRRGKAVDSAGESIALSRSSERARLHSARACPADSPRRGRARAAASRSPIVGERVRERSSILRKLRYAENHKAIYNPARRNADANSTTVSKNCNK